MTPHHKRHKGNYDDYRVLVHLGYVGFGTLLTGFVGAVGLWPDSHLWALVLAAVWASVVLMVEMTVWWRPPRQTAGAVLACFVTAVLVYSCVGPNLPPETATHGNLLAADDPMPQQCNVPPGAMLFALGNVDFIADQDETQPIITLAGRPVLWIEQTNNGAAVDADIFNEKGNLVARIGKNEFNLGSGDDYSYTDHPDMHTLTVHDRKGDMLFSVKYLNPRAISIIGKLGYPVGGYVMEISPNGIVGASGAEYFGGISLGGEVWGGGCYNVTHHPQPK